MTDKVFSPGEVLTAADVNNFLISPGTGNLIINGAMDFWQRGTSITVDPAQYTADRWRAGHDVTAPTLRTVTRQTFTPNELKANRFGDANFYLRSTLTTIGSSLGISLNQRVEDVRTLAGQTATLSFWAKSDSTRTQTVDMRQVFGSGGSTQEIFGSTTFSTTTSWQRFTVTFSFPNITGKTIGANSWIGPNFQQAFAAGSVLDLWGVQLEAGAVATPFRRNANSIQGELAACQRYYVRFGEAAVLANYAVGFSNSATSSNAQIHFPVTMRVNPTSVDFASLQISDQNTYDLNVSAIGMAQPSRTSTGVGVTHSATATAFRPCVLKNANTTAGFIGFSAEL